MVEDEKNFLNERMIIKRGIKERENFCLILFFLKEARTYRLVDGFKSWRNIGSRVDWCARSV